MTQAASRPAVAVRTRASDVVEELQGVLDYSGALLARWDPSLRRHSALAVSGYEDSVAEALTSERYVSDPKWPEMQQRRAPLRWADLPGHASTSTFFREVLRPHGLLEGLTLPLYAPAGYVGMLALNVESRTPPNEDVVALLDACRPSLSGLLESAGHLALVISADGYVDLGDDVRLPNGLVDSAQKLVSRRRSPGRFLIKGAGRDVYHAEIVPCSEGQGVEHLVTWRPGLLPYGLTLRELDVVSGLVGGLSNREIAAIHNISDRTVSTHVERILGKFDATTRTALAASALGEGIYMPSATGEW